MSSPYKSKTMRLEVNGVTVDTVELVTLEVLHTGGVESKYGQDYDYQYKPRNRHAIGMKRCRFTIRKWYKADSSNTDLFYTLFDNDTEFTLKEYLAGLTGFAGLTITGCEIYNYTPTTGAANDIIQEEIIGEGTFYEEDIVPVPIPPHHTSKFGYEDLGGGLLSLEDQIQGQVFTITEDGDAESISIALWGSPWLGKIKCAIYKHSDLSLIGVTEEKIVFADSGQWHTFNFTGTKPSLISGTAYILVAWAETQAGYCRIGSNFVGGTTAGHVQAIAYNGYPNPLSPTDIAYVCSIYCTYTVWD